MLFVSRYPFYFRFSLLGSILAVIGLVVFINLGNWQVHRAAEKDALEAIVLDRASQSPFLINNATGLGDKIHAPVRAIGRYDSSNEILIDNAVMQGNAGYYVFSPLVLDGQDVILMVNRGWVPLGRDRSILPELPVVNGQIEISGVLVNLPSHPPLVLIDDWHAVKKRWPFFNYDIYAGRMDKKVLPYLVQLDADDDNGFLRLWPQHKANSSMHIGYAIQWYAFAAIVFFTYLGVNIKRVSSQEMNDE